MRILITHLRIGEKIGLGFGIVGLLFLTVIWQYHTILNRSLNDYRQLQDVHAASKDKVLAIETELLQARLAEKSFRLKRKPEQANRVSEHIGAAQKKSDSLANVDKDAARLGAEFKDYLESYLKHFHAVEAAWLRKGLDENTGLQGSFREAVHDLESMARHLDTDRLYLILLQIRRGEKDLSLRRESLYQQRVHELIGQFEAHVQESNLLQPVKDKLLAEIDTYRNEFSIYADNVLQGGDLLGGKGPFRDAAHVIEKLITQYYVPGLERDILQLRRREKDYLLRADKQYVDMAVKQIEIIESRIQSSGIDDESRKKFLPLLYRYRDDFLSLVEQNQDISRLTEQMDQAANHVAALVNSNVQSANRNMVEVIQAINDTSQQRIHWMNWIIFIAIALGIFFAIVITRYIVVPMRRMATVLEHLTYTELVDPVPHIERGRDEVNDMAGYINTLAEHRNRFIHWWESSMNEADACEQLRLAVANADDSAETDKIMADFHKAVSTKKVLISDEFREITKEADKILTASAKLQHPTISRGEVDEQGRSIHYSAELIRKSLNMLSHETVKES